MPGKAAAAELRERVAAALGEASSADPENSHLTDQLCKISGASISTMDSFFLSCVKPMFDQVGLPADFRIGDRAELDALRAEAMEDTVECLFDSDEDSSKFSAIVDAIGSARTEDGLDAILLDFCPFQIGSIPGKAFKQTLSSAVQNLSFLLGWKMLLFICCNVQPSLKQVFSLSKDPFNSNSSLL